MACWRKTGPRWADAVTAASADQLGTLADLLEQEYAALRRADTDAGCVLPAGLAALA